METTVENEKKLTDPREITELDRAFELADNIITKNYLAHIDEYALQESSEQFNLDSVFEHASLFRVKKIVYNREENSLQKLVNTYASSVGFKNSIVMIIDSNGKETKLFLGTNGAKEISSARASAKALSSNFIGNFPGSLGQFDEIAIDNIQLETLMRNCTKDLYASVSSVSGVGSTREDIYVDNVNYIQGIEKMIDTMQGTPFSAIFIANTIDKHQMEDIKAEYEVLYSRLVPFLKSELSFNESSADGVSKTLSKSLTSTITKSKSSALSSGTTESTAHTEGQAITNTDIVNINHAVGHHSATTVGYAHSISRTKNWSDTTSFGTTKSQTSTIGDAEAKGEIKSIADGTSQTETTGRSLQITYTNKTIQELLNKIDEQLERIRESENYGVFAAAAYFLAATPMAAIMAASSYKGLINGNCTHVETAHINSWQDSYKVNIIKNYLKKLQHPVFKYKEDNIVTPASIVSGRELAIQMGLPRKSIPGVSVLETASFGRNIEQDMSKEHRYIELGNLYHMGREEESAEGKIPVKLDLDSLSMHTFITGSTGSGKSNAIYSLLENIVDRKDIAEAEKISFLVIEPAKGEYKDKFGYRKDVRILGTNAKKMELLRINPFSFSEDIHVLEHIDKLVEIFNVCWPMYAAMPAILKDAVERAYMNSGWNLLYSECKYESRNGKKIFPCFADVLQQISMVISESQYSADSKGDYSGALCTRIKSLTNGLYKQIFTPDELTEEELFDYNVIVDLSRVGSTETKSLIMGLLVMKMQEYRMARRDSNNSVLKHLTVLEEAHNLLKRTSTEQSSDSSNLLGKSVEMLANSIAEMRTYGEGFIIADQAPGLLDMAVIRNTNTKIILRLPDLSDRELVGRAASLNDNQIVELSKLKTGIAAVYQNNWLEPVLCHITESHSEKRKYEYSPPINIGKKNELEKLVDYIMLPVPKKMELDTNIIKDLEESVFKCQISANTKVNILRYINEKDVANMQKLRSSIVYNIFNSEIALRLSNSERNNINSWYNMMLDKLEPNISFFEMAEQDKILAMIANENAERTSNLEAVELFDGLMSFIKQK